MFRSADTVLRAMAKTAACLQRDLWDTVSVRVVDGHTVEVTSKKAGKPTTRPPGCIEKLNGQQLYFAVHGTGEPLLLLHGFSGSSQDWIPSLEQWGTKFQLILPDLRGHGRSGIHLTPFRDDDAATDTFALLDHLGIRTCKGVGISAGGNVLLHMATRQPDRITSMVLVSATPCFPAQARAIMSQYADHLPEAQWETLRGRHPGGDAQGDSDPLYPIELFVEMCKAIPHSRLWIVRNAGHGPVIGARWPEFIQTASTFLEQ